MPVIEVQREIIPSAPGGTEVWKYPQVDSLSSPLYNGGIDGAWFISWVAYLNQEDSFVDRYAQHVALTDKLLLSPSEEDPYKMGSMMKDLGVGLEGIELFKIKEYPKLYMPIEGTGNVIGHLAAALWSYQEGMTQEDIGKVLGKLFRKTRPGQLVIEDAQSMGMINPLPRGNRWDIPPNAVQVLRKSFHRESASFLPDQKTFEWVNREAGVVFKYPDAPAKVAAS